LTSDSIFSNKESAKARSVGSIGLEQLHREIAFHSFRTSSPTKPVSKALEFALDADDRLILPVPIAPDIDALLWLLRRPFLVTFGEFIITLPNAMHLVSKSSHLSGY
jgi:hypothetical protein